MKLSASRIHNAVKLRIELLFAAVKYSFLQTTAYAANNWGNLISTFVYTATYLAFLEVIFANVKTIAGYTYGEMLFLTLIGQLSFYIGYSFSIRGAEKLIKDIKTGDLDLILAKPVPAVWYLFARGISIQTLIVDSVPPLIPIIFLVFKKGHFQISPFGFLAGTSVFVFGVIITHCLEFIAALTAIKTGEAKRTRIVVSELLDFGATIPFEGYPKSIKKIGTTILPILIQTALAASYFLGKTTSPVYLIITGATTAAFLAIKMLAWKIGLRYYSSASS